LLNKL